MAELIASEGPWRGGINSVDSPSDLLPGQYQWATNLVNKGGVLSTRPGVASVLNIGGYDGALTALHIFTPRDAAPVLVMALSSGVIQYVKYPFTGNPAILKLSESAGTSLSMNGPTVQFETAVIGVTQDTDGNITAIDPYAVLMICDGTGRTAIWDGATLVRTLDPGANETPVATWMKWIGNRLWAAQDGKIRVSDLMNPVKFTEEDILAEGGYFNLPGDCTGLGVTPDFRSLLAFTNYTTTSFQAGIINRAAWGITADFQKVIFSNIGCVSGRSIINQYGMTWWFSHNGLINLDNALQTYRSSEIRLQDSMMRRSRSNFSGDMSQICCAAFDNYLIISVPSGDLHNYHNWVMDRNPSESTSSPPAWASVWTGIRPTQWASGVINGAERCFCVTCDIAPSGYTASATKGNLWETFLADKRDIGYNSSITQAVKPIECNFETRLVFTNSLCQIKYVELDVSDIVGSVSIEIHYATRRGTYKQFGSKQVVGSVGSVHPTMTIPVTFEQWLPQRRTIRSVSESLLSSDAISTVETPQTRNIDKYFSFVVKWTGQMSIDRMRVYGDVVPDSNVGASEENETTDRYIRPDGTGAVLSTSPVVMPVVAQRSQFLPTVSTRLVESVYQSLT